MSPGSGDAPRGRLVGVFGPFGNRALIEVSAEAAMGMVGDESIDAAPLFLIDSVNVEVEQLARRAPEMAGSALASVALSLAYEMSNPYNSATSKAACARELREAFDRMRELVPPAKETSPIDELRARRTARRSGASAPEDLTDSGGGE